MLRNLGNSYFASFGSGQCVSSQREENLLAVSVMNLISNLLNFGFQSSLPKLVELTPVRVTMLCLVVLLVELAPVRGTMLRLIILLGRFPAFRVRPRLFCFQDEIGQYEMRSRLRGKLPVACLYGLMVCVYFWCLRDE